MQLKLEITAGANKVESSVVTFESNLKLAWQEFNCQPGTIYLIYQDKMPNVTKIQLLDYEEDCDGWWEDCFRTFWWTFFLAFAQNVWIEMIHLYLQTKMTPLGYRAEHDVMISKTCFAIYDFI